MVFRASIRSGTIKLNLKSLDRYHRQAYRKGHHSHQFYSLFFNADLVQRGLNRDRRSMAFVDDYNAWVTGPSAEANREGIQATIDQAMDWERRSGATFEGEKTVIIHFTRIRSSSIANCQYVRPPIESNRIIPHFQKFDANVRFDLTIVE
jgi:hypothetical protein